MTLLQLTHVLFESFVTLVCLLQVGYLYIGKKKDPKTTRILICTYLSNALFNIADGIADVNGGHLIGTKEFIMQNSTHLAQAFLYLFSMFLTAYIGRVLYLENGEKPVDRKLLRFIYILCAVGILLLLPAQFPVVHMVLLQISFVLLGAIVLRNRKLFYSGEFKIFLLTVVILLSAPILQAILMKMVVWNLLTFIAVILCTVVYRWENEDFAIHSKDICLTAENIDKMSDEIDSFMLQNKISSKTTLTVRLKVEESLLRMRERFGKDATVDFYAVVFFGKPVIQITLEDVPFNPLAEAESGTRDWSMEMIRGTTLRPRFAYYLGKNHIRLSVPRQKSNPTLKMIVCILVGSILGLIAEKTLTQEWLRFLTNHLLNPGYDLLINILSCSAGPIIFLMVIATILNTGAISSQGIRSEIIVGRYFLLSAGMAALTVTLLCLPVPDIVSPHRPGHEEIMQFAEKIIKLVPEDIFAPIRNANTPQLLVMAIVLGGAVVATSSRGNALTDLIRQSNYVGIRIAEWIGKLIPYFSILIVAYAIIMAQMREFYTVLAMLVAVILISSLCTAASVLYVSITRKVKVRVLMKKCKECLILALKTGTTYSIYETSEECCINELGVRKSFVLASLPMGTVLYMPANAMGAVAFVLFAEAATGMHISVLWLFGAIILSVVLIAATPPIPGANCMAYMMIISLLGINQQYIILALIYDILFSSFATAANQLMLQMEIVVQADRAGLLNRKKLTEQDS